jgi:hypothetical protein
MVAHRRQNKPELFSLISTVVSISLIMGARGILWGWQPENLITNLLFLLIVLGY